jgi:predicted amidohydrolase
MPIRAACAQIAPEKAAVAKNLDLISSIVRQATSIGQELIVFPETSTTGYFLEGGVLEASLEAEELASQLGRRLTDAPQIDMVIGFYEREAGNLYNSAAYLEWNGTSMKIRSVYRKFFLPTYGVFDEERFVSAGTELACFETRFGKLALLICEDVWHSILPTLAAVSGAQIFIVPAASPARGFSGPDIENHARYRRLLTAISEEHGVFCLNAQLCGFEGGKGFVGGSMATDPFGKLIAEGPIADPHLLTLEIDLDLVPIARAQSPLISDLQGTWSNLKRLVAETR